MAQLNPKHYDEHSSFQKTVAQELLQRFPVHNEQSILDIGCGDGFITAKLATVANNVTVYGIDPALFNFFVGS